jgi:hypothetical protein
MGGSPLVDAAGLDEVGFVGGNYEGALKVAGLGFIDFGVVSVNDGELVGPVLGVLPDTSASELCDFRWVPAEMVVWSLFLIVATRFKTLQVSKLLRNETCEDDATMHTCEERNRHAASNAFAETELPSTNTDHFRALLISSQSTHFRVLLFAFRSDQIAIRCSEDTQSPNCRSVCNQMLQR